MREIIPEPESLHMWMVDVRHHHFEIAIFIVQEPELIIGNRRQSLPSTIINSYFHPKVEQNKL